MKAKDKTEMYKRITEHGENLKALFNLPAEVDAVKLCKRLFTLEKQVNRVMCNLSNTNNINGIEPGYKFKGGAGRVWVQIETSEVDQDLLFDSFKRKLENIIGKHDFVFFNHDPRGYSLKIKSEYATAYRRTGGNIYTDLGGYGIIAPDFSPR